MKNKTTDYKSITITKIIKDVHFNGNKWQVNVEALDDDNKKVNRNLEFDSCNIAMQADIGKVYMD